MEIYRNVNGDSGINSYEIGNKYIDVKFNATPKVYRYSFNSAGRGNVETMKKLAKQGHGLNSFININAKFLYEK